MAKTDIQELKHEIALRDALVLNKYPEPTPLDQKKALAETTALSKMKQPVVHAWTVHDGRVFTGWFTAASTSLGKGHKPWFEAEYEAAAHLRNVMARRFAAQLVALDAAFRKSREAFNEKLLADIFPPELKDTACPPTSSTSPSPSTDVTPACGASSSDSSSDPAPSTAEPSTKESTGESTASAQAESTTTAPPAETTGSKTPAPARAATTAKKEKRPVAAAMSAREIKRKADKAEARSKEQK